jgi:Mg2+/Co2+ transporter CorB
MDHRRGDPVPADVSGFFSGSETALTAASRGKLRNMADRGEAGAKGRRARWS